jgi:hypothetical protein
MTCGNTAIALARASRSRGIASNALAAFAACAAASLAFFSCESFDRASGGCDDDCGERDRGNEHALSFRLHHGPLNPYA